MTSPSWFYRWVTKLQLEDGSHGFEQVVSPFQKPLGDRNQSLRFQGIPMMAARRSLTTMVLLEIVTVLTWEYSPDL